MGRPQKQGSTWEGAQGRLESEDLKQPVWERQPSEPPLGYEWFRKYRDAHPGKRSASFGNGFPKQADIWRTKFQWVLRARAYDAWLETILLSERESQQRQMAVIWAERQNTIRQMEYELAMGLANKIKEMLNYPVTRVRRSKQSKDGKTVYLTIIEPARWDWKAAADMLQRTGFTARMSAEMVTDGARAQAPDSTTRGASDVDAWLQEIGVSARVAAEVQ